MGFFYPTIQDLCYMPIRLSEDSNEVQKIIKFLNDDSKSSILIFVDYFGRTWNNLLLLSKKFQYLVVIDHHQTCVNAISDYKIENIKSQIKFTRNRTSVDGYNEKKIVIRCSLKSSNLLQIIRIRLGFLIKEGKQLAIQRNKKVENLVKYRKTVAFGKDAVGYALYCDDLSIMNQLGNALGILAMRSGDKKLGADYHDDNSNYTQYKINLRSAHHDENGVLLNRFRCDVLAESFGGGGHVGAASLNMKKKEQKKLMSE
ncbi:unnamed protein product [Paramecium octaurelia]|uniref:DHHA1 domain-containing protein n=1 Tax=Paramecium octaurelia TaxID=43137 RepID=A0A8S1U7B9_PAROT|nr:unnamed protein product [Paramecium octaurelia]